MGLRFPADLSSGYEGKYEFKLYDGAAGIGIVLLDLYRATRDQLYARTVEEISYGLVTSTPEHGELSTGLYSGFAGVALFHLSCARILKKQKFLDYATDLGIRLSQSSHIDTDLFRGAAGAGWIFLALFHATRDPLFLEAAKNAVSFLVETRTDFGNMYAWTVRDPRQPLAADDQSYGQLATHIHTGLAHGSAGICLFLLEFANLTGDLESTKLLEGAFQWLKSRSFRQRNGIVWPRSEQDHVIQDHWCHGSAGIGQAYLSRYHLMNDETALEVAEAAAEATWNSLQDNRDEPFCHCHGLAGAIEIFLDVAKETGKPIWNKRAKSLVNRLQNPAAIQRDAMKPEGGGTSLGLGTAGIVRQLLRLSGHPVFPILNMDRDPLSITTPKEKRTKHKNVLPKSSINDREVNKLLPPGGIKFTNGKHYLVAGPLHLPATRAVLKMVANRPAGDAYFLALNEVKKASQRWAVRYKNLFVKGTIGSSVLGRVLREIAGMVLHKDGNAALVRKASYQLITTAIKAMDRMFQRVETDMHGVLGKETDGRLAKIEMLGNDPHFGGQRAVALQFEDGQRFLYKGRSVAIDREFAGISVENEPQTLAEKCQSWLHPAFRNAQLPTHRIVLASPEHGYAEEISSPDVVTFPLEDEIVPFRNSIKTPRPQVIRLKEDDEKRYWYSAGLLAGHAFSLGMFDLHSENVVSGISKSTPLVSMHAVDLEIALGDVFDLEDTHLIEGPRWGVEVRPHSHTPLSLPSLYCGLYAEDWVIEITSNGPQPVSRPWKAVRWVWPHLIQNSDGTFGYTKHVCLLLRGFADQWIMFQSHASEIADHLKEKLTGVPLRVVFNPTRSYLGALLDRKLGGSPIVGISVNPVFSAARPFAPSEIKQLDRLDIPYYFRILGEDGFIYWRDKANQNYTKETSFPSIKTVTPFWSVVENQSDPNRFARAVVDIVWQIVPQGPFDFHEPSLGVRVVRTESDERVVIIVVLNEKRLICKVATEGKIEWWLD